MKKKGKIYWAKKDIVSPLDGKWLSCPIMFWYSRVDKDLFLVVLDSIFNKDPIRRKFILISEKKFRNLSKGHQLQEEV